MSEEQIIAMNERLERIERLATLGSKNALNIEEASQLTGFTKQHIYRLTSTRQIPFYKRGRKLFFDKAELERWLLGERVPTREELESEAETYLSTMHINRK